MNTIDYTLITEYLLFYWALASAVSNLVDTYCIFVSKFKLQSKNIAIFYNVFEMDKFVTSFRSLKRKYEDNEFETDNPEPSVREREREPDIQDNTSSKINAAIIDEKENYLLDGKFFKKISNTGSKMSVTCLNCTKKIIAYSGSTGNLLSHYKVSVI